MRRRNLMVQTEEAASLVAAAANRQSVLATPTELPSMKVNSLRGCKAEPLKRLMALRTHGFVKMTGTIGPTKVESSMPKATRFVNPGPPHQHRWKPNVPEIGPKSGFKRYGPEALPPE